MSKWVVVSTPCDAGEAEPLLLEHFRVSKSTDFNISMKRSRHSARNLEIVFKFGNNFERLEQKNGLEKQFR